MAQQSYFYYIMKKRFSDLRYKILLFDFDLDSVFFTGDFLLIYLIPLLYPSALVIRIIVSDSVTINKIYVHAFAFDLCFSDLYFMEECAYFYSCVFRYVFLFCLYISLLSS